MTGKIPTVEEIDALHHKLAPSEAAYDLIHTHCVIVATITKQLIHRQNALFMRRCTLPNDAIERTGNYTTLAGEPADKPAIDFQDNANLLTVPATDGVTGGMIPPHYIDANLPYLGALLHDIGAYRLLLHDGTDGEPLQFDGPRYIQHGLIGYDILLNEGYDDSIAQYARNHTGVGITEEVIEKQHLPLPLGNYAPMNLEQEVVMVADKYHSKSTPPKFLTASAYARKAARFGEHNKQEWLELVRKYGEPDVETLSKEYHMRLVR